MKRKMKTVLKGAFTVDAPRKRLRMWVGIPILIGANIVSLALQSKIKALVAADRPMAAAGLQAIIPGAVGGALVAFPYTRWAGGLVLGIAALNAGYSSYYYGTQAGKDAVALTGASRRGLVQILGGR